MKQYLRMRKSCEIYPSYDLRVIENLLMNPISQKTSVIKQKGIGWSEFWTFNNHIILFTTVNNRKIRYKKSGKYSQPDHRSLRPQPSLSSDTMPVDENERRTKVLKKFAREINTKYTDKYTSDEDPRSIQKFYQTRSMMKRDVPTRDVPATKTEYFDAIDFNSEFSKKVSYFEYGPTGVSKKDLVSKSKKYNSTNMTSKVEPARMELTKKVELKKNPEYSNSKTYSSMNISTKSEPVFKNCENGDCGSHFEATRNKLTRKLISVASLLDSNRYGSSFRWPFGPMEQYSDDDHREDAPHFS